MMDICDPMNDPYNQAASLRARLKAVADGMAMTHARMEKLETIARIFEGCIETGVYPTKGSEMHRRLSELLGAAA